MVVSYRSLLFDLFNNTLDSSIKFIESSESYVIGQSQNHEIDFEIQINNTCFYEALLLHGNLGMGESYMAGHFEMKKGKLEDFLEVLLAKQIDKKLAKNLKLALKIAPFRIKGWLQEQAKNVQSHYDIDTNLFSYFLDTSLTYSCGYVIDEQDTIEQLQINKFERICQKLELKAGERLLDIGCGYGGMLIYGAKLYGTIGFGVTNSKEHFEIGNQKIKEHGLEGRIKIQYSDFTEIKGEYDKLVSIGMMEHLSRTQYDRYFNILTRSLKDGGKGLIHCVGSNANKNEHDYFIQKYIFPMSNQPKLSEISGYLEKNNLPILDVENMIRHYGYTASQWLDRFKINRPRMTKYHTSFLNMFEYYLCCCIAAAKASDAALYQTLFMKNYYSRIPLRRV